MMKLLSNVFIIGISFLGILSLIPVEKHKSAKRRAMIEESAVYMSDIDGLVKAVMLYGMTNGITYNGTNYMFVVEPKED